MASPIGRLFPLDDTEYVETWIRCFEALARLKKLRDRRSEEEQNEITDIFLATAGLEATQKVSTMAYPRNLEELNFKEVGEIMKRNIRPKKMLVIAERIKFQETRQHPDESIVQFVHRLKERARYCERLGTGEMTTDDLVMLRLIEGTHDPALKHKLLEMLQSVNLTVEICIEFVQQLELIKKMYSQQPNEGEAYSTNKKFYANTVANGMTGGKLIAHPSARYTPFANKQITPDTEESWGT